MLLHENNFTAQEELCLHGSQGKLKKQTYNTGLCLWVGVAETTVDHSSTKKIIFDLGEGELDMIHVLPMTH